jgi:hypothetical protein
MNKKRESRGDGSSSSYFYLLLLLFCSVFSLCYVNSEQAMFYLLIAFPSRRQGRKLSQPAFALTCISPQIHTHTPFHSIHTGYGEAIGQVNVKRKVSFSFFLSGWVLFSKLHPATVHLNLFWRASNSFSFTAGGFFYFYYPTTSHKHMGTWRRRGEGISKVRHEFEGKETIGSFTLCHQT